jgi:hypothetical protein
MKITELAQIAARSLQYMGALRAASQAATACFRNHAGRVHEVSALSNAFASRKSGVCESAVKRP